MNIQDIEDKIGTRKVWSDKVGGWIDSKDISSINNCIIYGDDGGDAFIKYAENEEELKAKLKSHLDGNTGCDFETRIYLIIKNGESVKVSSFM